jgi:FKBP-type peptidyl-prolyl cis-trans isomerase
LETTHRRYENGFEIEDLCFGPPSGKLAKAGKKVFVKYIGKVKSTGKVFDKSPKFAFRLGKSHCLDHPVGS